MFRFSPEHELARKNLRRWAAEVLQPRVESLENGEPPYELMREFAQTFGIPDLVREALEDASAESPPRVGIAGPDAAMSALVSIELTRVCPGFMLAFGASMGLAGGAILAAGTPEQVRRWALPLLAWEKVGAWGMTEPEAGSDAFRGMRTVARRVDGGYCLSGQKTFITNAPYADIFVVYAVLEGAEPAAERSFEAFVIERDDSGVEVSKPMRKMGMHASPTGEIFLSDCTVPSDRLLGLQEGGGGRASGAGVFHSERTAMAPMCVGIIERSLEIATEYALDRHTWGRPIGEYQLVQEKLARMYTHLQNAENLMFKDLWLRSRGESMSAAEASATKLYCARAATECAMEAVQILGGNGYMREYQVEMLARDAKLLQIGGGTDEIQILSIARGLLRRTR